MSDPYDTRPTGYDPPGHDEPPEAPESLTPTGPPAPSAPPAPPRPRAVQSTAIVCTACGYNLTGVAIGGTCPECGSTVDPSLSATHRPTSGLAIASMVLGICSVVTTPLVCVCVGPIFGIPCGIAGMICWHLARKPIREGRVSPGSRGIHVAGLITNLVGLGMGLIIVGLVAFAIISDSSSSSFHLTPSPPSTVPAQPMPTPPGPRP